MRTILCTAVVAALLLAACSDSLGPDLEVRDSDGMIPSSDVAAGKRVPLGPDDYDYTVIHLPETIDGWAFGIDRANTRGDLVGSYYTDDGWRSFLFRKGSFEKIYIDGAKHMAVRGINARGEIVGVYYDENWVLSGFHYYHGKFTTIVIPLESGEPAERTSIQDINEKGVMTGYFVDADGFTRGFLLDRGRVTRFAVPGSDMTAGLGINVHNQVVGHFTYETPPEGDFAGHMYGFVYDSGNFTIIDYPGDDDWMSCGMAISVHGEVGGHVGIGDVVTGFIWKDGEYLSYLRINGTALATFPTAIAPNGTIAGYGTLEDGTDVGFLATPKKHTRK